MKRREFNILLGGAVAWPVVAHAQALVTLPRIGFLSPGTGSDTRGADAFEAGLRELGLDPGRTCIVERRYASDHPDRLEALAAELVRARVDVIFTPTTLAAQAAKRATGTIPIVFANIADPVALGLVESLARPGANVTGLASHVSLELVGKQLELLKELGSSVTTIAVLWRTGGAATMLAAARSAAQALGLRLASIEVQTRADFEAAFHRMSSDGSNACSILPDGIFTQHRAELGQMALNARLPCLVGAREDMAAGFLISYGASRLGLIRSAAGYVDRILRGAKPLDLPVRQPTSFELIINLKTAAALDLSIRPTLLARADEVIE